VSQNDMPIDGVTPLVDEFLTDVQLATMLRVTTRTTMRWRRDGDGPAYVRCGARRLLYSRKAVDEWLSRRCFAHRAAETVASLKPSVR
jgi:hypothetical protein